MKDLVVKLRPYLIWLVVIGGTLSVVGYHLILRKAKITEELIKEEDKLFRLGVVNIDTEKREIHFKGRVQKTKGWVQFLIYLQGYKWLEEESAIISDAKLSDLQKAIAFLDWKLWDEIYYKKVKSEKLKVKSEELAIFVRWGEKEIMAQEMVRAEDTLGIEDLVFLGSPHFDHIALEAPPGVDCKLCPIFPLEQKALRELFVRSSGQSGYELNREKMPEKGTEVTVIIRIKK